jgi:prolyl-tRNA editing enzyme YbaK/EbsC (Cys-tRNA(Pro) deacylase)
MMSKSLKRVTAALAAAGLDARPVEMGAETRTAVQAAAAAGCTQDQIAKSIMLKGQVSGRVILFLTAGGNQVDLAKAAALAGEPLGKASADDIRDQTGFAIGGVAPLGQTSPVRAFADPRLMDFDCVFAAAGTPRHIFPIRPADLLRVSAASLAPFTT